VEPREQATGGPLEPGLWVEKHGDALFRYAMLMVGDREAAEERVQETFLAALQARESFREQSTERTWLTGILRHKIADHFRQRARSRQRGEAPVETRETSIFTADGYWRLAPGAWSGQPAALLEQEEFRKALRGCLGRLPTTLADAICLREMHRLGTRELCDILDISPTNLTTRLSRARAALRRCLEVNWFGEQGGSR
jgi:RNA polymerase sigma-70 factor (ECF subfamily)